MNGKSGGALRLVLFGPPGVGKGTQAAVLQERRRIPHVSTGDMLRAAIRTGTPVGLQAKAIVERGELVPDALISALVGERLEGDDVRCGFILDGFPRTVTQAEFLDRALLARGMVLDRVINLTLPEEDIIDRLTGRRVCVRCGANYHLQLKPPRVVEACDVCCGPLSQRKDDSQEVIRDRLRVYGDWTAPVLEHYRGRGLLIEVDGRGAPGEVAERIGRALRKPAA